MTQRYLAERIGVSHGTLARWETGHRTPDPTHVAQILTALEINGARYDELLSMARGASDRRWLAVTLPELRAQLFALLDAEVSAVSIREVSPLLIPGLLQISSYTRAIMLDAEVPSDEVSTRVALRMGRRDILTRGVNPARYLAIIGEAALRQVLGTPAVMVEQLRFVLEMAQRPNIEIRVVPFRSGWHPALEGPFFLIEPDEHQSIVHLETRRSGIFLHEEEDVEAYRQAIDHMLRVALSREETSTLIADVIKEMGVAG
ncbi:helix-turn-helix protein [Streptoalloteichus tenebrarius]|uniref:Helix-turn-helix protein n=1 Tax=Streptoalloteichus tenebrarius (strain ATCC 17920 / DSM 40477 / JCM 4838 / CBS 697.72 / NBRC 16177 / NCIMB 11028 / NRRL B-12390 / A12253. 1 / ISP 5477) TaxID=1933 RepID=A0ABT1HYK0_STRSD|nr:helix-turn-helix protein [Streptoalloteichus tenebrarius]BFF01488.1 helix-turn-helix transcriptional regulator [Streptoalloteichus tenebrarius]